MTNESAPLPLEDGPSDRHEQEMQMYAEINQVQTRLAEAIEQQNKNSALFRKTLSLLCAFALGWVARGDKNENSADRQALNDLRDEIASVQTRLLQSESQSKAELKTPSESYSETPGDSEYDSYSTPDSESGSGLGNDGKVNPPGYYSYPDGSKEYPFVEPPKAPTPPSPKVDLQDKSKWWKA